MELLAFFLLNHTIQQGHEHLLSLLKENSSNITSHVGLSQNNHLTLMT